MKSEFVYYQILSYGLSPCGESGLKLNDNVPMLSPKRSLPMRGEWIEIYTIPLTSTGYVSLPMRGEWIEITSAIASNFAVESLPMRGEWIEMSNNISIFEVVASLPMRGEWIEIVVPLALPLAFVGLSPCGESGLKCRIL